MKTSIGGDRLGSGNKQNVSMRNYERSTHDLSYKWRSSMSVGTLVPFMSEVALPGDSWDIDLNCEVLTLPTLGPLFGSMKVQLDVFQVPVRLYNASLHMNKLGIGMEMDKVFLPGLRVAARNTTADDKEKIRDNYQINPSCLLKYLGISGIGRPTGTNAVNQRTFNAVPYLAYWDIFKNYYANKQEDNAWAVHHIAETNPVRDALFREEQGIGFTGVYTNTDATFSPTTGAELRVYFDAPSDEPFPQDIFMEVGGTPRSLDQYFNTFNWVTVIPGGNRRNYLQCLNYTGPYDTDTVVGIPAQDPITNLLAKPQLSIFPLKNIDDMRLSILQADVNQRFLIGGSSPEPYNFPLQLVDLQGVVDDRYAAAFTQEGLAVKTYQSDLLQNWISTEWIDGPNGVNEVTKVSTAGDAFTIDALNLAKKVYVMLNRIAISGGTYDDWLDAVYTHERTRSIENPMYMGSLIKELAFQEVVSTADTDVTNDNLQPLGTLAGRGRLTGKHKGGRVKIKVDEPSYIMGIVSITPRIDYSQGNKWDVNLDTMDDFHKPALDGIGFQDLITDQMAWQDTSIDDSDNIIFKSAGKQPAWINYMTAIDRVYGNFADEDKDMFMVLNRRYNVDENGITDLTTYIDPAKFNNIFAQTELSAQNFWVQIGADVTARRKMSAKIIPNL